MKDGREQETKGIRNGIYQSFTTANNGDVPLSTASSIVEHHIVLHCPIQETNLKR